MQLRKNSWRNDLLLTLGYFGIWLFLVRIRPFVIHPRCITDPAACLASSVNAVDRYFEGNNGTAEEISLATQYVEGALALFIPLLFHFRPFFSRTGTASRKVKRILAPMMWDLLIIGQVIALNGALTELIRLVVQRPRPFVYGDPSYYGLELQNYTSFVSGHTSFSTAIASAIFLVLSSRQASRRWLISASILSFGVAFVTGFCRVAAGRHFLTDVLAAAVCGAASAVIVAATHRIGKSQSLIRTS